MQRGLPLILAIATIAGGATAAPVPAPAVPVFQKPATTTPATAEVLAVRSSTGSTTRIVADLSPAATYQVVREPGRIVVTFPQANAPLTYKSFGGEAVGRMRLGPTADGARLEVEVSARADVNVFPLHDPERVVIDATLRDDPPPAAGGVPAGVTYAVQQVAVSGISRKMHLLSFDPALYTPRVVTAGWGAARNVLDLAQDNGAVAAINGGYFDPASSQAVDLVVSSGGVLAYALGMRPALALGPTGLSLGNPKGRLRVRVDSTEGAEPQFVNVSTVNPVPRAGWVTAFVGDGFVPAGAAGFVTLTLANGVVVERHDAPFTPAPGEATVTFQPAATPLLDLPVGAAAGLDLNWADARWEDTVEAVAAGPTLVRAGTYAVDGKSEGFDVNSSLWRPTRQSAFAVMPDGRYVLAMLEYGAPEDIARALLAYGAMDAIRLDSGTSSALYLNGGMLAGVWGRPVPNAIALVPR